MIFPNTRDIKSNIQTESDMIIDFHCHAFPQKIAGAALSTLKEKINIEPYTDGTVSGTVRMMDKWGIDRAVICNIATNPRQQTNVNNFAIETAASCDRLFPLGSIHPDSEAIEDELQRIKSHGLRGIKIHPDYMGHCINEKCFDVIFDVCSALDLFVITHAGFDVCSPDLIHATPDMISEVIARHPRLKLVAAHFGSNEMYGEVEEKLCGKNLWIDTSLAYVENTDPSVLMRILNKHDGEKILFASDCPWCPPDENVRFIEDFGLGDERNDNIFFKNALKLLK